MSNKAWAVSWCTGDSSSVYFYNGSSWSYICDIACTAPGAHDHASVWGITPDDVWFAISKNNATRLHHYLNGAWTTQDVAVRIQRMWGLSTNDIWAIGFTGTLGVNSIIEWWHYNGITWSRSQLDVTAGLYQYLIYGKDASTIWSMRQTGGDGTWLRTRYNDGSNLWSVDDGFLLSDGNETATGVYGLYCPIGEDVFYMLTRTDARSLALYSRVGIGAGQWTFISEIPTMVLQGSGVMAFNNCFFKRGEYMWAIHPDELGAPGECWYSSDNGANWVDVTPADSNHLFHIHGNANIIFMGGNDGTSTFSRVWCWNTSTQSWDVYNISDLGGNGKAIEDIWVSGGDSLVQCSVPIIDSSFTINNMICLPTQHKYISDGYTNRTYSVPYFLNVPGISLRYRRTPVSSSF